MKDYFKDAMNEDPNELRPAIEALLDKETDAPLAGRTREDIITRLMLQASDGSAPRLSRSHCKIQILASGDR